MIGLCVCLIVVRVNIRDTVTSMIGDIVLMATVNNEWERWTEPWKLPISLHQIEITVFLVLDEYSKETKLFYCNMRSTV